VRAPLAGLADAARANVESILRLAIEHPRGRGSLVLFDRECPLAVLIADAWREALPDAPALELPGDAEAAKGALDRLPVGNLVVLVESTRFFPEEHRLRVRLFDRGLAVVELPHLSRIEPGEEAAYVDALAYDPAIRAIGRALKDRIDRADRIRVEGEGQVLEYRGGFAKAGCWVYEPAGAVHDATSHSEDTVYLANVYGPIAYLNDDGAVIGVSDGESMRQLGLKAGVLT